MSQTIVFSVSSDQLFGSASPSKGYDLHYGMVFVFPRLRRVEREFWMRIWKSEASPRFELVMANPTPTSSVLLESSEVFCSHQSSQFFSLSVCRNSTREFQQECGVPQGFRRASVGTFGDGSLRKSREGRALTVILEVGVSL